MENVKIYNRRCDALKFSKKVNGEVSWFQVMGTIKKKDKWTGKIKYKPALITKYKVHY